LKENMAENIYQIQIALKDIRPKIWRRILIPSELFLSDFHKIIQTVMGWENYHLHQFVKNRYFYSVKLPDADDLWDDSFDIDYNKNKTRVSDLLQQEKEKIIYEYDFGDGWEHDVILEKVLPYDKKIKSPFCLAGKMSCPPEDCGGTWGYMNMVKILKNPDHKEYESYIDWLGGDFDPEYFDKEEINEILDTENFGCLEFLK